MRAHILTGTKRQIAEQVAQIDGEVREAIIFVEEPADFVSRDSGEDLFAEMEPYMVKAGGANYSREAIYNRMEGE